MLRNDSAKIPFVTYLSLLLKSFLNTQKCLFLVFHLNTENLSEVFLLFNLLILVIYPSLRKLKSPSICVDHDKNPLAKIQCHYKFSIIKIVKKDGRFSFSFMPYLESLL